jgi:carboxyl-terminal processing protease
VRALRTALLVILVSLGFLGGYFAGWQVNGDNVVKLTPGELDAASEAGQLTQRIIEELQGRYYREVDPETLSTESVTGMLESLDDPYTVYLTPKQNKLLEEQTKGEYSGIGASLQKKDGGIMITGVFDGSPAGRPDSGRATSSRRSTASPPRVRPSRRASRESKAKKVRTSR